MTTVPHHPLCGKELMPVAPPRSAKEAAIKIGKIVEAMFCGSYAPLRECEINEFTEIISDLLATARKEAFKEAAEKVHAMSRIDAKDKSRDFLAGAAWLQNKAALMLATLSVEAATTDKEKTERG